MKHRYLGIAATVHDPAIAIMDENGKLLFAEALERVLQHKIAWDVSPTGLFTFLEKTLLRFHDVDTCWHLGVSWCLDLKIHHQGADFILETDAAPNRYAVPDKQWGKWLLLMQNQYLQRLEKILPFAVSAITGQTNVQILGFDHHLCHAANASYFYSGEQPALVVTVDGEGEVGALSCYELSNGVLKRVGRSWGPGSLGSFYSTITNLIGFDFRKGEEWKVMGLSAYGKFDQEIYNDFAPLLKVNKGSLIPPDEHYYAAILSKYKAMREQFTLDVMLAANVAFVAQQLFEETLLVILKYYQQKTGLKRLILGGGCALNSRFNGLLSELSLFESVFVPPAPGDDGNAVGVAALLFNKHNLTTSCLMNKSFISPYLGHEIDKVVLQRAYMQYANSERYSTNDALCDVIAKALAAGKLVGWVQGRAEFGPRALGNRSILANPSFPDIKNIINDKIKYRENYRPFAPVILHEQGQNWFKHYQFWPYMGAAIEFVDEKCSQVSGVVHEDKTGRVQSVSLETNPLFYQLLKAFEFETGLPILLNTSLNVMGKPIVHCVEDALATFLTSGLDLLVIEDCVFSK